MALSQRKRKRIARLRSRKMRPREGFVLVEGLRTCGEVLSAGIRLDLAVASSAFGSSEDERRLLAVLADREVPVERTDPDTLAKLSDTESPQGLLLVCEEPTVSLDAVVGGSRAEASNRRLLLLDGIQDPGNAGTLVRAARAFALDGVVALDGTVDPWNPKAVRAAAGAGFHLPVTKASWDPEVRTTLGEAEVPLLVADPSGETRDDVSRPAPWALVVGGEVRGARAGIAGAAEACLAVPMPGGGDSLNAGVAGAILLYALTALARPRESARTTDPAPPSEANATGPDGPKREGER